MIVENVTPNMIQTAIVVFLAFCGALKVIDGAADTFKKWKKPQGDVSVQLQKHEEYFAADKRRLDQHDKELSGIEESNRVQLAGIMALLEHEIHNGNEDQLIEASNDINVFLRNK